MADAAPESVRMTPLAHLLKRQMDENNWTYRDVCRPTDGVRVGGPARSTASWHLQPGQWLKTNLRPETVRQLAVGFRLPVAVIMDAADLSHERYKDRPPSGLRTREWLEEAMKRLGLKSLKGADADLFAETFAQVVDEDLRARMPWLDSDFNPADYDLAARRGTPRQAQIDAAEPDPNVDPPHPED